MIESEHPEDRSNSSLERFDEYIRHINPIEISDLGVKRRIEDGLITKEQAEIRLKSETIRREIEQILSLWEEGKDKVSLIRRMKKKVKYNEVTELELMPLISTIASDWRIFDVLTSGYEQKEAYYGSGEFQNDVKTASLEVLAEVKADLEKQSGNSEINRKYLILINQRLIG